MNTGTIYTIEAQRSRKLYHGRRADLKPGDLIEPCDLPDPGEGPGRAT